MSGGRKFDCTSTITTLDRSSENVVYFPYLPTESTVTNVICLIFNCTPPLINCARILARRATNKLT